MHADARTLAKISREQRDGQERARARERRASRSQPRRRVVVVQDELWRRRRRRRRWRRGRRLLLRGGDLRRRRRLRLELVDVARIDAIYRLKLLDDIHVLIERRLDALRLERVPGLRELVVVNLGRAKEYFDVVRGGGETPPSPAVGRRRDARAE